MPPSDHSDGAVVTPPRHRPFGDSAVLVELDTLDEVLALDRALRRHLPDWVSDLVPAARTVLVRFDHVTVQHVSRWIDARWIDARWIDGSSIDGSSIDATRIEPATDAGASAAANHHTVRIPVRYDGADLAEVAQLTGLTVDAVIAQHTGGEYTVAFCGFAPGFAYLSGVPMALRVPRRATPRTAVPAGAVALADEFAAVYPRVSPGGWQLIGTTDLAMFDVDRQPPVLLSPGTRVRFVQAPG